MSSTWYQDAEAIRDDLVQFMQDIIRIPSLSSQEGAVVERIRDEMVKLGAPLGTLSLGPRLVPLSPSRADRG